MNPKQTPWVIHLAQTVCIRRVNSDAPLARIFGPRLRAEANARLIVAATNAAKEINPENPTAAVEAMPEIFRLLQDAVCDALKVSHGKLDPEKWLTEASAAIAKAMWKD